MIGGVRSTIMATIGLLLCCNAAPALASLNMTDVCLLVSSGTLVGSLSDCSTYYKCQGATVTTMTCSTGQYFSKDQQSCVDASLVSCASAANPCASQAVGTWAAMSGSCGGWYYCSASGPLSGSCPSGENFNPLKQICAYASNYPCTLTESASSDTDTTTEEAVNLCAMVPNGRYFGDAMACNGWNYCQDDVLHSGDCPTGLYYSVETSLCNYRQQTNCQQVTNDTALASGATGTTCDTAGATISALACNQYYECVSGTYQLQECQSGYFYDTDKSTCVLKANAKNNCDRCIGSDHMFVNAYSSSSCAGYLVCSNGVETSKGDCITGYYFDESKQACVVTEPKFACCNPNCDSNGVCTAASTSTTASSSSTESTTKSSSSDSSTTTTKDSTTTTTKDSTTTTTEATTTTTTKS